MCYGMDTQSAQRMGGILVKTKELALAKTQSAQRKGGILGVGVGRPWIDPRGGGRARSRLRATIEVVRKKFSSGINI